MQTEYIYQYLDAQQTSYPRLKFITQSNSRGFGIFQQEGCLNQIQLELARVELNPSGVELARASVLEDLARKLEIVSPFEDVVAFHKKFGLDYDGPPRKLDSEYQAFRDKCTAEEYKEWCDAKDDAERFDAGIDLIYFILGEIRLRGWPFSEGWRRVQAKNMAKERAKDAGESKRGFGLDVVKPPGWTPPDLSDLVVIPAPPEACPIPVTLKPTTTTPKK